MKKLLIFFVVVVLIGISEQGLADHGVFYVDAAKLDNSGDGLSWATAKRDIQAAVDLIPSQSYYDKIWVTNGVYDQGGGISDLDSSMSNRVSLNSYHDNMIIEAVNKGFGDTVIVGAPDPGTGGHGPGAIRCFHGNDHGGDSAGAVWVIGFTLKNGYTMASTSPFDGSGGAMHSAKASNCWFYANHAYKYGGAAAYSRLYNCQVWSNIVTSTGGGACMGCDIIDNCMIYENQAPRGGAGYSSKFYGCVLSNNYATSRGGVMYANCEAYNCTIVDNHSAGYAGVMLRDCITSNCVIRGNTAGSYGSVISETETEVYRCYLYNCLLENNVANGNYGSVVRGYATLINCTIVSNRATSAALAVGAVSGNGGNTYVTNCIIYNNWNTALNVETNYSYLGGIDYSLTTPLPTNGTGNVTGNPRFRDPANADYHLSNLSPAVDAGTNVGVIADLDGITRPQDGNNDGSSLHDIGCYEHVYVPPKGTLIFIN